MKIPVISVLLITFTIYSIECTEPKNMEELEDSEDWEAITDKICEIDQSNSIKQQIEKCNQLDPYYKFDSLTRDCDKLRAPPGSTWYDEERGECAYNDCYKKLSKSKEFEKLRKDTDNLDEETRIKKGYEKYKCIRKVLGLKV